MPSLQKPRARRFGLLCFPVSGVLCAGALMPGVAKADSLVLSPRGEQPQEENPVPYEPYEDGAQGDRQEQDPPADPDTEDTAGETPESGGEGEQGSQDQDQGQGEAEIQYDQAPADTTGGQGEQTPPSEGQGDQTTQEGEQEMPPEMEFGEPAEGDGEEQPPEMEFGEPAEGEAAPSGEGDQPAEGAGEEMQFEEAEPGEEMQFGGEDEEAGEEMQFGDDSANDPPADEDEGDGGFVFEDISEDEEALAQELQAGQKQAKGVVGTVRGMITGSDGQEVMGAYVETQDKKFVARSGVDGSFELKLNPGVYTLRVRMDGYDERLFEGIQVVANESLTLDASITPLPGAVQTMVIEEEVAKEGNVGQSIKRQKARATRDIMSREEMSKSGGSSTSSVARRIVGSTVVGGRYIFVRGLGHRYGNTLLDGARVPSPNPDLRTVPLDIFPTSALSAINVQKTFTPDVPADFAGGSVQLETREIPEQLTFKVGASMGGNTVTTFRQQLTSQGAAGDAFGLGNRERGISDELKESSSQFQLIPGNVVGTYDGYTPDQLQEIGRSLFLHTLVKNNTHAPVNFSGDLSVGKSWKFGGSGRFGLLFAGGYKNGRGIIRGTQRFYNVVQSPTDPALKVVQPDSFKKDMKTFRTSHKVASNGILLAKLKFDDYNRIDLTGMYSRDTDNAIQRNDVIPQGEGILRVSDRLRYTMRSVAFSQIKGRHEFPRLANIKLDWFYSFSGARRDDPAMRQVEYLDQRNTPENNLVFELGNSQISTAYLDLKDSSHNAALNAALPFRQWSSLESLFKIGGWAEAKDRKFISRSIRMQEYSSTDKSQAIKSLNGLSQDLVTPQSIDGGLGTDPNALFFVNENTQPVDNYEAKQTQFAGYALMDLPLTYRLKVTGGVRYEHNLVKVTPRSPYPLSEAAQATLDKFKTRLRNSDFFPSIGLTFDLNETMKLRLSGSRTTARPEMRELAPFIFTDFLTGLSVAGYPYLQSTKIWNADLRWEWFIAPGEVLSATLFYKNFSNPIESVIGNTDSLTQASFRNAKAANNVGFELEGKKNLAFIAPWLRPMSFGANFAYVHSRVKLYPAVGDCSAPEKANDPNFDMARCLLDQAYDGSTSRERPLQDQSPFVINAFLDYDFKKTGTNARVLYNTFGRRIFQIGGSGMPDVYEESVHGLDLMVEQAIYRRPELIDDEGNILAPARALKLKLSIGNLLNYPARFTQEKTYVTRRYRRGADISLGLSWSM